MSDGDPVIWSEEIRLRSSHFAERATLPIAAAGVGILVASVMSEGTDRLFGVVLGLAFFIPGSLLFRAVRRSALVVTPSGRLSVRVLREQPQVHLEHATSITHRFGITRVTVDGDFYVGQATVMVPIGWWESEHAVKEILRETARVSGCAVEPSAALVLGIAARCEAGQELPPRMPTAQAVAVLTVVAATTVGVIVHLASAVLG